MAERGKKSLRTAARTRKMRARNYHVIRVMTVALAIAIAFGLGFVARGHSSLLARLGFSESVTGVESGATADTGAAKKDAYNSVSVRLSEVEDILKEDSLTPLTTDSFEPMLLAITDDNSLSYYSPESYQSLLSNPDESYAGIGVLFSEYNGQAYAVDVFEGSQAQKEGVQEGDFVVSVNADESHAWSRSEVTALLSQENGKEVVITWRRPESLEAEGGEQLTTSLLCREYQEKNITTQYDEERHVAYVKVKQLTQNTAANAQKALAELAEKGAAAYVLDLRNNPGGYLSQAVELASLFMSSGTVVQVQTVDGASPKATTGRTALTDPLVVLVNKDTAGAAEVVAAALKESQRATLVGTTTMGRGSVQVTHELSFGGAVRYTAAYYLTPSGHPIDKVGVTPNVEHNTAAEGDSQKTYAMNEAASKVPEQVREGDEVGEGEGA